MFAVPVGRLRPAIGSTSFAPASVSAGPSSPAVQVKGRRRESPSTYLSDRPPAAPTGRHSTESGSAAGCRIDAGSAPKRLARRQAVRPESAVRPQSAVS